MIMNLISLRLAIAIIAILTILDNAFSQDNVNISFSPKHAKLFNGFPPIKARIGWIEDKCYLYIDNVTDGPVAIMKSPIMWSGKYILETGEIRTKQPTIILSDAESRDHIVLLAKTDNRTLPGCSAIVATIVSGKREGVYYEYRAQLGCLAPPYREYIKFDIEVKVTVHAGRTP